MNPVSLLTDALRGLPAGVRRSIYSVLGLVGAALAVCVSLGITDVGPVTTDRLLEVYAYLSTAMGGLAVANVGPKADEPVGLVDFDEDADLSSFEPVGDESDVFAEAH